MSFHSATERWTLHLKKKAHKFVSKSLQGSLFQNELMQICPHPSSEGMVFSGLFHCFLKLMHKRSMNIDKSFIFVLFITLYTLGILQHKVKQIKCKAK